MNEKHWYDPIDDWMWEHRDIPEKLWWLPLTISGLSLTVAVVAIALKLL